MSQFDTTIKPILHEVSKILKGMSVKKVEVDTLVSEDSLCTAFLQACSIVNQPKDQGKGGGAPPEAKVTFPRNSPCCWTGCDKKVAKVERILQNKTYCTRHYKLMCKKLNINPEEESSSPPKTSPAQTVEANPDVKGEDGGEEEASFNFRTHPAMDFMSEKNLKWWSLVHYDHPNEKYLLHKTTNCIFNSNIQIDEVLVGWLDPSTNIIIPTHKLPAHILSWLKKSKIPNLPNTAYELE